MELVNNRYLIDNVPVWDLIGKYGSPIYVYETARMEKQYKQLEQAFKGSPIKINYACKALTNINVLRFFKELGSGLDAVSLQEVVLGLQAGFDPQDILYTPNCVSMEEINKVVELGVRINIDSYDII